MDELRVISWSLKIKSYPLWYYIASSFFFFFGNFSFLFSLFFSFFFFFFILLRTYRSNEILVRRRPPTILRYYNIVEKCFAFYKSKKFKGMLLASNCSKHSLLIISSYRLVLTLRVLTFLDYARNKIPTFGIIDRFRVCVWLWMMTFGNFGNFVNL